MKTRYFGFLAVLILVASFVVPGNMASPTSVEAAPGLMEWKIVDTPDSEVGRTMSLYTPVRAGAETGSGIIQLLVASDGNTIWALVRDGGQTTDGDGDIRLFRSTDGGRTWSGGKHTALTRDMNDAGDDVVVWRMAISPDDPKIIAVACSIRTSIGVATTGINQQVWISTDKGDNWDNTNWPPAGGTIVSGTDLISTMDISMEYGSRELLVGTRDGAGLGTDNIQTMKMPGYGGWNIQDTTGAPVSSNPFTGDVIVAKFSPTYVGDSTIAVVYTDATGGHTGTFLCTGVHDLATNKTAWQAGNHVEIMNSGGTPYTSSPRINEIITADMQLPSDFSGQSASLRRIYVSTDASERGVAGVPHRGVFRVDDTTLYTLMDNSNTFNVVTGNVTTRRVSTIAYWGTYASGKLLVGEVLGSNCEATVPTWFTDSPTVCPVPCWYPAKKPTTGAARIIDCNVNHQGYGNAQVAWSPTYADQGVAYVGTSAASLDQGGVDTTITVVADAAAGLVGNAPIMWPSAYLNEEFLDESAFGLTRNNGETWNQLSLIDTRIAKLTDVAPSADCSTVYLASTNNATDCNGFDSVWRSSSNEAVVAPPLPALPVGQVWERVMTHVTAVSCNETQSDYAILRLAPDKLDGQIVFWAAGGTSDQTTIGGMTVGANTQAVRWSPDFGDYWANINPRIAVQDMEAESSTLLYILSLSSQVQKMPYTGTAWSSANKTVSANTGTGHTIDVQPEGKVMVGAGPRANNTSSFSSNGATSFPPIRRPLLTAAVIGYHVKIDTDFDDNSTVYIGNDNAAGRVYRNVVPAGNNTDWTDIMNGWTTHRSYFGIVQSNSKNVSGKGTLYAAHAPGPYAEADPSTCYSGVERTLNPLGGVPKPGVFWDCMDAADFFQSFCPEFTLEPKSLKICGCLTEDTNSILWAIDNDWYAGNHSQDIPLDAIVAVRDRGMLWAYEDCVAKIGPTLTMDDGTIIGCDPATGRNQEVNFTWEQLCIATEYDLHISKDEGFSLRVYSPSNFRPYVVTKPAILYFANGGATSPATGTPPSLECGHLYWWRIRVRDETTDDYIRSPWSEKRNFTIKAGFRVTTPYYGPQLLSPDNGCGCACDAPLCFSWSPFKETTGYKFELSENADMSSPLVTTNVTGATAYQYDGKAKCNTNYFWRVMAIEPAPSEWSAVFSFMTQAEPPAPPPPAPTPVEETPMWVWVIIGLGAVLVIVTLVLIFKTRRV